MLRLTEHHFLTSSQAAKMLGISRIAVYKKIKKGKIKAIRIGKNFAIPEQYIKEIRGNPGIMEK